MLCIGQQIGQAGLDFGEAHGPPVGRFDGLLARSSHRAQLRLDVRDGGPRVQQPVLGFLDAFFQRLAAPMHLVDVGSEVGLLRCSGGDGLFKRC